MVYMVDVQTHISVLTIMLISKFYLAKTLFTPIIITQIVFRESDMLRNGLKIYIMCHHRYRC